MMIPPPGQRSSDPYRPNAIAARAIGAANPTVKTLHFEPMDPTADSDSMPVSAADRVIWNGSSTAGAFTAVLFTRYEGANICHWSGYVLSK